MKQILFSLGVVFLLIAMFSCDTLKDFSKLELQLKKIDNITIADIEVAQKKTFEDFEYKDITKLATVLLTKELPLNLTFIIQANNKSRKTLVIEKMDYIVFVDGKEVVTGKVENKLAIPPKVNTINYIVETKIDIISLFKKENLKENLILALKLISADKIYNRLDIKVKPYMRIGKRVVIAPYFIAIKHNK